MFCTNCGAQLPDDVKFCTKCGTPVRKPEDAPSDAAGASAGSEPATTPASSTPAQPTVPPKPRSKKPLIMGAAAAVVIAVAAVAGYFIWSTFFAPYPIDEETFPDGAVRDAIVAFDADGDGALSREEAEAVNAITVNGATSLDGLERCPNITSIDASSDDGSFDEIDLGSFGALEDLTLRGSASGELNLSGNTHLTNVSVYVDGLDKVKLPATDTLASLNVGYEVEVEGAEEAGFHEVWVPVEDEYGRLSIYRDEAGNILSMDIDGFNYAYEYDEDGNLESLESGSSYATRTQTVDYYVDEDGNLQSDDYAYTYDDEGRITRVTNRDLKDHYLEYTYDDAGNVIKTYDARGNGIPYVYTYEYDDNGKVTEAASVDYQTGEALVTRTFTYDEGGHIQKITHDSDSSVGYAKTADFTFDEETLTLTGSSTISEDGDERTHYIAIQYNERGDVIAFEESSSKKLTSAEDGDTITYGRYFTKEGAREPLQGARLDLIYDTYVYAQFDTMLAFYKEGPEMVLEADPYVEQSTYPMS